LLIAAQPALAATVVGGAGVLPAGNDLGEGGLDSPRERFRSDYGGGERSYLVRLGDVAFSAPSLLGSTPARPASAARPAIPTAPATRRSPSRVSPPSPAISTRPAASSTGGRRPCPESGAHPSLRGARLLAPYGHDGRSPSLRDFVRNVVVGEFAGPEPSPQILDALVAYIQDIDFLPNPRLGETASSALQRASSSGAARRCSTSRSRTIRP